jgi:hypothetical protein
MHPPKNSHLRAAIEVGFIIFLFYSNLLMGEFTVTAGHGKTLVAAVGDIITLKNFAIALFTSVVGHLGFEILRRNS